MKKFYVTTPIYYVNSEPHVGSAYTTMFADIMSRFYRLANYDVKFLTGTDEHGQKIEASAKKTGENPKEFVDRISEQFRDLVKLMEYSPNYFDVLGDNFIRTTMDCHILFVQNVWRKMVKNGWLYEGNYEGWYCVSDEAYYSEEELIPDGKGNFKTDLGKDVEWKKEKTYFFKLGELQKTLLKIYEKLPNLVRPVGKKSEVISFISGLTMKDYLDGKSPKENHLKDLSVSRNSFDWGIKIPCDLKGNELLDKNGEWKPEVPKEERHVIYVWFDALFNYLTALGCDSHNNYKNYWLENDKKIHLIGKDILRPHAVYWPAFLVAFNYTIDEVQKMTELDKNIEKFLPSTIFAHGWLTNEGLKISKSLGNAVVPSAEIEWLKSTYNLNEKTAVDYLKYYLIAATPFGNDGDYSRARLIEKINSDLANKIGNLAKRTLDMIYKNCDGKIPEIKNFDKIYSQNISNLTQQIDNFDIISYLEAIMKTAEDANKYMDENAPWKMFKENKIEEMNKVLYSIANTIKNIGILLQPICPNIAYKILKEIGLIKEDNQTISFSELNIDLKPLTQINEPTIIIPRLQNKQ